MFIRFGYEIGIDCDEPTPMATYLAVDPARRGAITSENGPLSQPRAKMSQAVDGFGNLCTRMIVPAGGFQLMHDVVIRDAGKPETVPDDARIVAVEALPQACMTYLAASRYCETDRFGALAWKLFGETEPGFQRVEAICDYVHERLTFSFGYAPTMRTAMEAHEERAGVCRDYAHLAVTLCRAMNIPARYVHGYLPAQEGVDTAAPMDFYAWFEAYLGHRWYTFDARHNRPLFGRIVVARARDAADIPLVQTFGPHRLTLFRVWTYQEATPVLTAPHAPADMSLVMPWFSEGWSNHVQQRASDPEH